MLSAQELQRGQWGRNILFHVPCRAFSTSRHQARGLRVPHHNPLLSYGASLRAPQPIVPPRTCIQAGCINPRSTFLLPTMTSLAHQRLHAGHSHGHHHHHHDNTYLTSTNNKDAGVRITRMGLYVNLLMAICKGTGGYVFNSQALVADAFHAMTDLVSDFMTLGTVAWSLKPPTARFPSGYGKIESLGSLGVSGLLLTGGVLMGLNACGVLYNELFVDAAHAAHAAHEHSHGGIFGHSHSHGSADMGPNINAAWVAAASIAVKEYLYRASESIPLQSRPLILTTCSNESSSRTKVISPCLKCGPSSDRFADQHRCSCCHCWITSFHRNDVAGSRRRANCFRYGSQSWLGQYRSGTS